MLFIIGVSVLVLALAFWIPIRRSLRYKLGTIIEFKYVIDRGMTQKQRIFRCILVNRGFVSLGIGIANEFEGKQIFIHFTPDPCLGTIKAGDCPIDPLLDVIADPPVIGEVIGCYNCLAMIKHYDPDIKKAGLRCLSTKEMPIEEMLTSEIKEVREFALQRCKGRPRYVTRT